MTTSDPANLAIAIISGLALIISGGAVWYARRANRLVGLYQRAVWTSAVVVRAGGGMADVVVTNKGTSMAQDVRFILDADPLATFTAPGGDAKDIVPVNASTSFHVHVPGTESSNVNVAESVAQEAWRIYFLAPERRGARVLWRDLEHHECEQRITLPANIMAPGLSPNRSNR